MKYCIKADKPELEYIDADELVVLFKENTPVRILADFLQRHSNQRIVLKIDNDDGSALKYIEILLELKKEYPNIFNYVARFNKYNSNILIELLAEADIPYFFNSYISNWEELYQYISMEVSDIYVVEGLAFELDKVSNILHNHNINVRVFPDVCQKHWNGLDDIKGFFIRPEDVQQYEDYIDILEIYTDEKQDIIYEIYAKDKKWFGELKEIIINFNDDFDSRFISPRFAEMRIKCNRKCLKGENCKLCERVQELSETLKDKGILITHNKKYIIDPEDVNDVIEKTNKKLENLKK